MTMNFDALFGGAIIAGAFLIFVLACVRPAARRKERMEEAEAIQAEWDASYDAVHGQRDAKAGPSPALTLDVDSFLMGEPEVPAVSGSPTIATVDMAEPDTDYTVIRRLFSDAPSRRAHIDGIDYDARTRMYWIPGASGEYTQVTQEAFDDLALMAIQSYLGASAVIQVSSAPTPPAPVAPEEGDTEPARRRIRHTARRREGTGDIESAMPAPTRRVRWSR